MWLRVVAKSSRFDELTIRSLVHHTIINSVPYSNHSATLPLSRPAALSFQCTIRIEEIIAYWLHASTPNKKTTLSRTGNAHIVIYVENIFIF